LSIPDFEGEAILRIFANSTRSEIGCFSAVVTNGATFKQPAAVGTILGGFTVVAVISSFVTAIHGDNIPTMRMHYAHSLSVHVVFAVWQHIFFSGALSMNWPSVLVAFWSNYAWAGGMIYTERMQDTINAFIAPNKGKASVAEAAASDVSNINPGGGYDIHKIYKRGKFPRALSVPGLKRWSEYNRGARHLEAALAKRESADNPESSSWFGNPVKAGLPSPGNYLGFAGTLAQENIPTSNAFMTGFLWYLTVVILVGFSLVTFKFILEGMCAINLIRNDRLAFFRKNYHVFAVLTILRILYIGFFMMIFLSLLQFTYLASPGPVAVACIVFLVMLLVLGSLAGYACFYRIKLGDHVSEPDRLNIEKRKIMKVIPWYGLSRTSTTAPSEDKQYAGSMPWWRIHNAEQKSVHDDEDYTKRFGWLVPRHRRSRWWFFVVWLVYEFIRACLLAGASAQPMTQVIGLLVVEFIAIIGISILRPFEGQRLNIIVIYLLGFSKVATVALSAAFDTRFNLPRIPATVIGVVIIVIHGVLTIIIMIAIVIGAVTSYMSVMRNREDFRPRKWASLREKYFQHMIANVADVPPPPPPPPKSLELARGPYFSVHSFQRMAKVEDEDVEFVNEIGSDPMASQSSLWSAQRNGAGGVLSSTPSKAPSITSQASYSSLPYGARVFRASWSSHNFREHPSLSGSRGNSLIYLPGSESRSRSELLPKPNTRMRSNSTNLIHTSSPISPAGSSAPMEYPAGYVASRFLGDQRAPRV
jgi:hypothetical protein